MKHKTLNFLIISFSILAVILILTACARKEGPEKIVATINDYEMTVEDFNYESKTVLRMGRLLGEMPVTKEDILDALISKELLLQEAQKENYESYRDLLGTDPPEKSFDEKIQRD